MRGISKIICTSIRVSGYIYICVLVPSKYPKGRAGSVGYLGRYFFATLWLYSTYNRYSCTIIATTVVNFSRVPWDPVFVQSCYSERRMGAPGIILYRYLGTRT